MQTGLASDLWTETKAKLLGTGDVPSKSTKSGSLYYPQSASTKTFKVRFLSPYGAEQIIEFRTLK